MQNNCMKLLNANRTLFFFLSYPTYPSLGDVKLWYGSISDCAPFAEP